MYLVVTETVTREHKTSLLPILDDMALFREISLLVDASSFDVEGLQFVLSNIKGHFRNILMNQNRESIGIPCYPSATMDDQGTVCSHNA